MSVLITQPRQQLKFADGNAFQLELRRRVEEYFRTTGRRPRACWQMYLKTAILLGGFTVVYTLLVFVDQTWWQGLLLAVLLGLSAAGIGFNIQHDGGHQAYSDHPWVNKLMAMTLELIGGSSHLWRWKHVVLHHTYVNITGHDTDIDLGLLARLTPHQRRLPYHRWQHLYLWPLYGLLAIKWQLLDDFRKLISGRISNQPVPGPKGRELVIFIAGKATFFTMAFGIPLLFHSIGVVLLYYGEWNSSGIPKAIVKKVALPGAGDLHRRQSDLLHDGLRDSAAVPLHRGRPALLRGRRAGGGYGPECSVSGRTLRGRGGVSAAPGGNWARRARVGDPSGGNHRGLRPAEPSCRVARRRLEFPDRAPPLPPAVPCQLPCDLETRGRDLSRVRDQVHGAQVVPGGSRVAFPVVAADGDANDETRYWVVPVSSMTLPARSTLILNGVPSGAPANLLRIFSMLSSDTTGMPSTERMMSPPRAISRPPMVTILSPPCRPMFHASEPWATVLTRNPAGAGTLKIAARSPVSMMPWRALQNTFRSIRSFWAGLIVTTNPSPSLPPDFEMFWLTMPMTSPAMLNMWTPELPVLIVAVVGKNSGRGMSRKIVLGGQRALIQPTLIE